MHDSVMLSFLLTHDKSE